MRVPTLRLVAEPMRALLPILVVLSAALPPPALPGQAPDQGAGSGPAAAYEERYDEVMRLAPRPDRVALVSDLVLTREPRSVIVLGLLPAEPKGLTFNDLEGVLCEVKMVQW